MWYSLVCIIVVMLRQYDSDLLPDLYFTERMWAFKGSLLNLYIQFALRLVMQPQSCRTSLLLVIILIFWAAGGAGSLARNLLKRKWTWMSDWGGRNKEGFPLRFLEFSSFLLSNGFSFFSFFFSLFSLCHSLSHYHFSFFFCHLCLLCLSTRFSSWPSDTSSWCCFNNLRGK